MKHLLCFWAIILLSTGLAAQSQVFQNGSKSDQIRTLTVYPQGDWATLPIINMGTDNNVEIAFDELSHDFKRYSYRIIHCNADWTRSDINELEYLDGFSENEIENYEQSVSAFTLYTHYTFSIPNEKVKLKLSGNYAVEVFDREGNGETLLTACFMVLENKTGIDAVVTATTDIDYKQNHQQLSFDIKPYGFSNLQPLTELKVLVQQNHRSDNEVKNITPMTVTPNVIRYEHNKALIFEAGNEYRRFEITTYKYAGMGVNKMSFFEPFYNAELLSSETRLKGYTYDKDQNGRFLINSQEAIVGVSGSDYFLVHFSLPMEEPAVDGGFFLNGDFVNNRFDANSKLTYSFERKAYEKTLFLKQGNYNFQYLYRPTRGGIATPQRTEGSYWETENEYQIFVYYRPVGERYDRLIGFRQIGTAF